MGLKKYEIITVGSDKRVRALRSWAVGDRYVNIGDVGGIVYDEKTLSQDGLCWLFRGNFGFPGARIGGDSIVDVGETALSTTGTPNVDILGSSVVVGSKLQFAADQTAANGLLLGASNFEPGSLNYAAGSDWEAWKQPSSNYLRTKAPIFSGGAATTLKIDVPGYTVQAYVLDRDGKGVTATEATNTGAGVTLAIPAGQYFMLRLAKNPLASIALSDVTTAAITLTGTYETKLSIVDSRLEINPATSTAIATIKPGGTHSFGSGVKYPEAIIRNSKVSVMAHATANREIRLMGQVIGSTATLYATAGNLSVSGQYGNVKNLMITGIASASIREVAYNSIQATDCDNFTVSSTIFPGLAAAQTANMPFIFQGCNVPDGRFYHHAQIANTYKNIDFAKAQADLGKAIASGEVLASSEIEGMYRLYSTTGSLFGALVEAHDSVRSLNMTGGAATYGTTIYKDAYLNGLFDIAGTNVFGNKVRSHPLAQVLNVQPRAVQGAFNTEAVGGTITGVVASVNRVCVPLPFRINGAKGVTILTPPAGLQVYVLTADLNNVITAGTGWVTAETSLSNNLQSHFAYVLVGKVDSTAITPEDLAGVTVMVYNGCKIVNTGETAIPMKGNIRVEDNATLINDSITGTGYFGGNAVMSGARIGGCVYMKDNAKFVKTAGTGLIRNLKMTENAYAVMGDFSLNGRIHLSDNARFIPRSAELFEGDLIMKDNADVSGNAAVIIGGVITMKDNARVSGGTVALSSYGDITLCGSYNQTVNKMWSGKRVIDSQDAPEYDNNVKSKYDF